MRKISLLLYILLMGMSSIYSQHTNITQLANVQFGESSNDIWGYVDANGLEYAVIGTRNAVQILSLEDPSNPILRATVQGVGSTWRDMKFWKSRIYATTDSGADGLLIINMSKAPDTITHLFWKPTLDVGGAVGQLKKCHNIYIDENGFAYLAGCNVGGGGPIFLDLNQDLDEPVHVGQENANYAHDVFVQRDTLFASDIYRGQVSIWDVHDKANPFEIGRQETTSRFTHNAWASEDGKYVFTTDERGRGKVDAYDITDMDNILRLDAFRPAATVDFDVIPHNTHYLNGYLIVSWYTDGIIVVDAHKPDNLIQVANYDTWPGGDGGFGGCWGAYPFLPSGLILASDIQTGLYVLDVDYVRACYLEGNVKDEASKSSLNNVTVKINSPVNNVKGTNLFGDYKTGLAQAGMYSVTFTHPDYLPLTIDSVVLENGEVTQLDVEMTKLAQVTVVGKVIDAETKKPIVKARVKLGNDQRAYATTANNKGEFKINSFLFNGPSQITAGSWGFLHNAISDQYITSDTIFVIELKKGYQDDFLFNQGWTVDHNAKSGKWTRGVPRGTFNQGEPVNPNVDVSSDLGNECYVTGNRGGGIGADDVDGGITTLISPKMDLTNYKNPYISFRSWFVNFGGNSAPDDTLRAFLSNGLDEMMVYETSESNGAWTDSVIINVKDILKITDNMRIRFVASDIDPTGHIVEAGIDEFRVFDKISTSVSRVDQDKNAFFIYPNPFENVWNIRVRSLYAQVDKSIELYDMQGHRIWSRILEKGATEFTFNFPIPSGVYLAKLMVKNEVLSSQTLIKH